MFLSSEYIISIVISASVSKFEFLASRVFPSASLPNHHIAGK